MLRCDDNHLAQNGAELGVHVEVEVLCGGEGGSTYKSDGSRRRVGCGASTGSACTTCIVCGENPGAGI